MVKVLKIEGMMCAHCQARVQKTLEDLEGVTQVSVSLEDHQARVTTEGGTADQVLIDAVKEAGYQVLACTTE
ncbi:MAG: heavy-metal-associated domain-containing protein [Clostridiales bacterium]|nr:heavy-metal-associated domain-containing protein [Clostridiales bacterium]